MPEHLKRLVSRAKEALQFPAGKPRSKTEIMRVYKRFRKAEDAHLLTAHRAGGHGERICKLRSDLIDVMLKHLWAELIELEMGESVKHLPVSLVATGGYGRRQMNPFSDVDLLFLLPDDQAQVSMQLSQSISSFQTMLWDIGFKVGDSSTRSVREAFEKANEDQQVKTALIEARLIAGVKAPFENFETRFEKACFDGQVDAFLEVRQKDIAARHFKHEGTASVQEPQVKTGCGGLRDYHNLLWTTFAIYRTTDLSILVKKGILTENAKKDLEDAYDFLLRVRTEMHYIEKREGDILTLRLQGVVATNLEYPHKKILNRIEAFMRDYYMHSSFLLHRTSEIMDRFHLQAIEGKKVGLVSRLIRGKGVKSEKFDGFVSKNNRLYQEHDEIFQEDPSRLMRLFIHTQQRKLRLSPQLFQLVQESFPLVDRSFRYSKAVKDSFEAILNRKGDVARTLRQMHRVGFIDRYIPEFGALNCLVQHEFFHRYTADEHTLRTIDKLDELAGTTQKGLGLYQKLFREMEDPGLLYLALLLHDSGRALNTKTHSDASTDLAGKVCKRLNIKGERRRLLMFLVDHHLSLFRIATTKNIDDPKVVAEFAAIVKSKNYLDALLIMTLVDSQGTSEKSWNSWKESLIVHLYQNTVQYLNDPVNYLNIVTAPVEELKVEVLKKLDSSYENEVNAHFEHMPRGYFNFRDAEVISMHIRAFRTFFDSLASGSEKEMLLPSLTWVDYPDQGCSELIVTCWDRHLLLARIAGALAAMNINILSADLYQRRDDVVLDVFRVSRTDFTPVTNERTKSRIKKLIDQAFETDTFDFSEAIAEHRRALKGLEEVAAEVPQRVLINDHESPDYNIIELQAMDRIGLLYTVFKTVGSLGGNVCYARISTEKGVALDAIYIQNKTGAKIRDRELLQQIQEQLTQAVFDL